MKRTLAALAIVTLIVPAVANAQTLSIPGGNNLALNQIVSRVIAGLTGVQYQNQYSTPQIQRRSNTSAFSTAYQNGYAQGLADARRAAPYTQYGVNSGFRNAYPQNFGNQNFGNRYNGFQRNARGSRRGGY
jgi:hypothetical protein